MNFKKILFIILFVSSCTTDNSSLDKNIYPNSKFSNKGFALIYDFSEDVKNNVSKKIDEIDVFLVYKDSLGNINTYVSPNLSDLIDIRK